MVKNPDEVMEFVRRELEANPDIETSALFEKAKAFDAGVKQLSLRQFNATFPLQIKRRRTLDRGEGRRRSARQGGARSRSRAASHRRHEAMRDVLLQFARDLTAAEGRKELVELLGRVDDYVDRALEAARK